LNKVADEGRIYKVERLVVS